jgi:hypothetical protein
MVRYMTCIPQINTSGSKVVYAITPNFNLLQCLCQVSLGNLTPQISYTEKDTEGRTQLDRNHDNIC